MVSGSMLGTPRDKSYRPSNIGDHEGQSQPAKQTKVCEAGVAFVIQNEKEVMPWKKKTPISTSDLN
jgi:hypothetical protein